MAPASKSKLREPDEDISQLREPITLHGKPVEQILNSIHYGSPELRDLLLNECDMIFECKVCRALFRDLPNFISHKRRFCSKSVAEINHFTIGQSPVERVVTVQPQPVDESEIARAQSSSASSSGPSLEDTLQRIRVGDIGNSYAFQVYTNAAAKLRHQKDHTRITSLRPREIPTNSNAVFVDVSSTSVNIHDRVKDGGSDSNKPNGSSSQHGSSNRRKVRKGKKRENYNSGGNSEEKQLRSRVSTNNSRTSNKKPDELTDLLFKELKVIQNRVKNKTQESQRPQQAQCSKESVKENSDFSCTKQASTSIGAVVENSKGDGPDSSSKIGKDKEAVKDTRQNRLADALLRKERVLAESDAGVSSPSASRAPSGSEEEDTANNDSEESSGKSKRSLICSKCGAIFSSRKSLQFHFKINHAVQRMFYPCPCCSNVYYYFNAVTRHLERNHNKTNKEVDEMRQMLRYKAFSRPSPSHDSAMKVVNTGVTTGSRRSLRYKETSSNKKLGSAPFVYSSINKGKKVLAKKDPVLNESDGKIEDELPKKEEVFSKSSRVEESMNPKLDRSCQPQILHNESNVPDRTLESTRLAQTGKPKSFADIGMQMQTCGKCLRLFGRVSTYENHIKVCGGPSNVKIVIESEDSSNKGKSKRVRNLEGVPFSARRKGKEPNHFLRATTISSDGFDSSNTRNSRSQQNKRNSLFGDSDSADGCNDLSSVRMHSRNSPQDVEVSLTHCKSVSPVKVKVGSNGYCPKAESLCGSVEEELSGASDSWNSLQHGKKESSDDATSSSSREPSATSTRLKSRGGPDVSGKPNEDSSVDAKLLIQDRPRRKRKVPSRNIEAVEMLQKIHRSDESNSEKSAKYSGVDNAHSSLPKQQPSESQGAEKSKSRLPNEIGSISKTKRRSSKIFISNKNKLECYNLSRAEKFMDTKKFKCLKCQARFRSKSGLKTHIARHLKWTRFQCKLCGFNCFHRSECSSHIKRTHLKQKGNEPDKNRSISSLIIDLSKKGSEAMALKKHETLKAKNQQQRQEEKDNLYKNQNTHRHPRLPDKKLDTGRPSNILPSKQQNEQRKTTISSPVKKDKPSPSSLSSDSQVDKDKLLQSRRVVHISHLVPRRPRLSANNAQNDAIPFNFNSPHFNSANVSSEQRNVSDTPMFVTNSSRSDDDEGSSTKSIPCTTSANDSSTSSNTSVRKIALPFNISTRKSPRVFDTSPYNREEIITTNSEEMKTPMQTVSNEVVMHTRHGAYTKTLPPLPVNVKESSNSLSNSNSKSSVKGRDSMVYKGRSVPEQSDEESIRVVGGLKKAVLESVSVSAAYHPHGKDIDPDDASSSSLSE